MTQERFLKLLDNPDLLATISYEELKTLALTYPYVQNLRYLLAIKAGQDNHPDYPRNLATAAAYSVDRTCLFTLLAPKKLAPKVVSEESVTVLELKPIAALQRELDARAPVERQATDSESKKQIAVSEAEGADKIPVLDLTQMSNPEQPTKSPKMASESNDDIPTEDASVNQTEELVLPDTPSFSVWISRFNPRPLNGGKMLEASVPVTKIEPESEEKPEEEIEKTEIIGLTPQKLAEKSVTESRSILSETLAKLYVEQGHIDKAIDMYQRLCLAFPDKSTYFAGQIDELKK